MTYGLAFKATPIFLRGTFRKKKEIRLKFKGVSVSNFGLQEKILRDVLCFLYPINAITDKVTHSVLVSSSTFQFVTY